MAVNFTRELNCLSDAPSLWRGIADTERMNRAVGLGRIEVAPLEGAGAARYLVKTRVGGVRLEYEERPFEFVENERLFFRRVQRRGPVAWLEMGCTLAPAGNGGTRVGFTLALQPRNMLWAPIVRLEGRRTIDSFIEAARDLDRELLRTGCLPPGVRTSEANEAALARAAGVLLREVAPARRALVEKLVELVRSGSDQEVSRMRPLELAEAWKVDGRELLAVCLGAVEAGLLELSWDLICPSCRSAVRRTASLAEVPEAGHCHLCDITFGTEPHQAVEATFHPPASIRAIDSGPYCVGGPVRTPHVVAQALLPAGGEASLAAPREPSRLRLFLRGGPTASVQVAPGAADAVRVEAHADRIAPAGIELAPGGKLLVVNRTGAETHAKLERIEWAERAATMRMLTALPEFRAEEPRR